MRSRLLDPDEKTLQRGTAHGSESQSRAVSLHAQLYRSTAGEGDSPSPAVAKYLCSRNDSPTLCALCMKTTIRRLTDEYENSHEDHRGSHADGYLGDDVERCGARTQVCGGLAATPETGDAGSITYAKETLRSTEVQKADDTDDTTTYYKLDRNHFISVVDAGVTRSGTDLYILTYDLRGMVFAATVPTSNYPAKFGHAAGAGAGDSFAVFRANADITAADVITLTAKFAVSENGGSITMKVQNRTLEGILGEGRSSKTHGPVSIRVAPALLETVKPEDPMPIAKASMAFKAFGGSEATPTLHATLGSIMIGVAGGGVMDTDNAEVTDKQFLSAVGELRTSKTPRAWLGYFPISPSGGGLHRTTPPWSPAILRSWKKSDSALVVTRVARYLTFASRP